MSTVPNLRALRRDRALTQTELAARSGVPQPTISNLESGRTARFTTIRKLARALRVKPTALYGADTTTR